MTHETKHTPTPWTTRRGESCTKISITPESSRFVIASVKALAHNSIEGEANARLIAAAPELLEALDNLAEHIDSKSGDFAMRAHFLKEALAALAKARGEA